MRWLPCRWVVTASCLSSAGGITRVNKNTQRVQLLAEYIVGYMCVCAHQGWRSGNSDLKHACPSSDIVVDGKFLWVQLDFVRSVLCATRVSYTRMRSDPAWH